MQCSKNFCLGSLKFSSAVLKPPKSDVVQSRISLGTKRPLPGYFIKHLGMILFFLFQVSHSKNGSINTIKVQKLVNGYVKKYKYMEKRDTQ